MKIEKYELTKNNNYNVYLSNGEVITLNEKVITENELLLKKEIDNNLYKKLNKENEILSLCEMSIKYISIRLRSIKEIREYLIRKKQNEEYIEPAIERLIQAGYLNDERFAKAFIKDKFMFTSMGDYKIKNELEKLGVSPEIIENSITEIDDNLLEEKIKKIIDKNIKTNKKYSGAALKNKIYNHLITSGYSKSKVIEILNNYEF